MITVTTQSGLEIEVNEKRFADFRVMRAYKMAFGKDKTDMDKIDGVTDLVRYILGPEKEQELFEYVADEDGFVDSARVFEEMGDIMEAMADSQPSGEIKNS